MIDDSPIDASHAHGLRGEAERPRGRALRRRVALWGAGLALVFALPWGAHAQGFRDVSLSWVRVKGAEGCIGAHVLAQAVEDRIGHPVWMATGDSELSVEGYVRPGRPQGFEAVIVTSNPTGEIIGRREIRTESADCHALDEPLTLVIALTIDPEAGFIALPDAIEDTGDTDVAALLATAPPAPPPSPAPEPTAASNDAPQEADPAMAQPPPAPEAPARLFGPYALAAVGGGQAPGAAAALGAGYAGSRARMRAGLEARFWLPRHDSLGTGGYRTYGAQLSLYGCPLWRRARGGGFEGMLCGGATPGLRVFRADDATRQTRAEVELTVLGRLLLHTTRSITPFLGADLGFVVYGPVLEEGPAGGASTELWRTPLVRGGASLGILFAR